MTPLFWVFHSLRQENFIGFMRYMKYISLGGIYKTLHFIGLEEAFDMLLMGHFIFLLFSTVCVCHGTSGFLLDAKCVYARLPTMV